MRPRATSSPSIGCTGTNTHRSQAFDVSVVIPTVGRESLLRAVESVFAQAFTGTIQILVGVDVDMFGKCAELREQLSARCPPRMMLTWLDLGYSTSRRHGGVHACGFGGALRSILTLCAQSEIVAYLDDDDWYFETHIDKLAAAIRGKKWAFSLCCYAEANSGRTLCVDEIESVGPDRGVYRKMGGFVRTSALAINKLAVPQVVHLWSHSILRTGDGEDRIVFAWLRRVPEFGATNVPTVCYALDPRDAMHRLRLRFMEIKGVALEAVAKVQTVR
jgi:glycosyltransferase involved in cell wall biosynthesis